MPFESFPEAKATVTFGNAPMSSSIPHTVSVADGKCVLKVHNVDRPDQCGTFNIQLDNPYGSDNVDVNVDIHGK